MSSPVLWGPNNISNSLQNKFLMANGAQLANDGVKNYLTYGNFENGLTTGWSLSHTTLSSNVPNQASASWTAAAGTLSISTVSSGQLAGNYSLSLASSAATTVGDMLVSQAYTIDIEDQGKVQSLKFYYSAITNSSNNNFSGTVSNTWQPYIYDVTNSAWIQPTGVYSISQGSGVGYSYCQWQVPSNMTQFRVAIVCINASAGATTLYFDDLSCGPSQYVYGTTVTDWQSYIPSISGFGATTVAYAYWRRVGDSIEISSRFSTGTHTAVTASFTMPNGIVADPNKTGNTTGSWGFGVAQLGTTDTSYPILATASSNLLTFGSGAGIAGQLSNQLGTAFTNSNVLSFEMKVPIQGWSSTTQTSDTNWPNVVVARYTTSTARTVNNTSPVIIYETKDFDNTGIYNTATGVGTIQSSGWYQFQGCFYVTGVVQVAGYATGILLAKNGSNNQTLAMIRSETTASTSKQASGSALQYFNAGDTFSILGYADAATSLVASVPTSNYFSIEKVQGPTTLSLTDTTAARYSTTSGQSIANGTTAIVNFDILTYDRQGSVTIGASWKFTANNPGIYSVSARLTYNSQAFTINLGELMYIYKNGVLYSVLGFAGNMATGSYYVGITGYDEIQLVAGDYIDIRTSHSESTARTLYNGAGYNFVEIKRVGN